MSGAGTDRRRSGCRSDTACWVGWSTRWDSRWTGGARSGTSAGVRWRETVSRPWSVTSSVIRCPRNTFHRRPADHRSRPAAGDLLGSGVGEVDAAGLHHPGDRRRCRRDRAGREQGEAAEFVEQTLGTNGWPGRSWWYRRATSRASPARATYSAMAAADAAGRWSPRAVHGLADPARARSPGRSVCIRRASRDAGVSAVGVRPAFRDSSSGPERSVEVDPSPVSTPCWWKGTTWRSRSPMRHWGCWTVTSSCPRTWRPVATTRPSIPCSRYPVWPIRSAIRTRRCGPP